MVWLCQKGENCGEIPKGNFSKNHRNCSEHSIAIHSISMAGYITTIPAFVCGEVPAKEASTFCDKKKDLLRRSPHFFSSLTRANYWVFYMCLIRITIANLCPNMIHFGAYHISECHSEEVISFFWRSVYYYTENLVFLKRFMLMISNFTRIHHCMIMKIQNKIGNMMKQLSRCYSSSETLRVTFLLNMHPF